MSQGWDWFTPRAWSLWGRKVETTEQQTRRLLMEAERVRATSPLGNIDYGDLAYETAKTLEAQYGYTLPHDLLVSLGVSVWNMLEQAGLAKKNYRLEGLDPNSFDGKLVRDYLRQEIKFHTNPEAALRILKQVIDASYSHIFGRLNLNTATRDVLSGADITDHMEGVSLRLIDYIDNVPEMIEGIVGPFFTHEVLHHGMFQIMRDTFEFNLCRASNLNPDMKHLAKPGDIINPAQSDLPPAKMVERYLCQIPTEELLLEPIPVSFPDEARFEHAHILAGSGHGKTQEMSQLILRDIRKAVHKDRTIIVMDSQGDLISKIVRLAIVQGTHLRDKLVIIDPTEFDRPVAINPFSLDDDRLKTYTAAEREQVVHSAVSLFEYFFGELLGAELTGQQGMVFKFLIRLLVEIPDATLITLRDLMDNPAPFRPHMQKLTGSARVFFEREFMSKSYAGARKQISRRLWAVLSNPVFERLFSSPVNKLDWFHLMQDGRIILINTAKDFLKTEGSKLLGRFLTAQIAQGILERAAIPEHKRTPAFFYLDEAHDQIDDTVEMLLSQGRKYKLGLTLAHQYLGQLTPSQRANLKSNTSLKFAGGLSSEDARNMAGEMRCDPDFLLSMRKTGGETRFAFAMRNQIDKAVPLTVPLGLIDRQDRVTDEVVKLSYELNRQRYGRKWEPEVYAEPIAETQPIPLEPKPAAALKPAPKPAETTYTELQLQPTVNLARRGSAAHRTEQDRIKTLAQSLGYSAEIETHLQNGSYVDVLLTQSDTKIGFEISITTPAEHEVTNLLKGVDAGLDYIVATAPDRQHLRAIEQYAMQTLTPAQRPKVLFLLPQDIQAFLETHQKEPHEDTIMGYRIITESQPQSSDAQQRRKERLEWLLEKLS